MPRWRGWREVRLRCELDKDDLKTLKRWRGRGEYAHRGFWQIGEIATGVVTTASAWAWYILAQTGYGPAWLPPLLLGIAVVASWALCLRMRRFATLFDADAMLNIGRCAACGYDLRGTECDEDGSTICAECGAAWRLGK